MHSSATATKGDCRSKIKDLTLDNARASCKVKQGKSKQDEIDTLLLIDRLKKTQHALCMTKTHAEINRPKRANSAEDFAATNAAIAKLHESRAKRVQANDAIRADEVKVTQLIDKLKVAEKERAEAREKLKSQ